MKVIRLGFVGAVVPIVFAALGVVAPPATQGAERPANQPKEPKTLSLDIGGGITMEFLLIPPGTFVMGNPAGRADERPAHKVTITGGFYLGKYEVTQEHWLALMPKNPGRPRGGKYPVDSVSWDQCQEFLKKLSEMFPGKTFRLPTEAEWEYACRAGSTTRFHFGNDQAYLRDYAWFLGNSSDSTHPVGEKKPNAWGLYDMYGNVSEWCADEFSLYRAGEQKDPVASRSYAMERVLRGGSWLLYPVYFGSASRDHVSRAFLYHGNGFRVLLAP